jgi:hypothetical protein
MLTWLKKHLVPHAGNDYRPHVLRFEAIAFVCLMVVLAEAVFVLGVSFAPGSRVLGLIAANVLTDETNDARAADSLPTLRTNVLLQVAAQKKANDMTKNGYFAHTSPTGVTPWYWFSDVGYQFASAGENLAVNFSDSQDVTNAWLNSPLHRANILNANFTEIGIATAEGMLDGRPAVYVVELFGTPASRPAAVAVAKSKTPASIVATSNSHTSSSEETFVAVKGAEAGVAPLQNGTGSANVVNVPTASPAPAQANLAQRIVANPRAALNYLYIALAVFFGLVLTLNIGMKTHIRRPKLVLGGVLVLSLIAVLVVMNQQVLFGTVVR